MRTVQGWGMYRVEVIPTRDAAFVPKALKLRFMVGTMGILAGEK